MPRKSKLNCPKCVTNKRAVKAGKDRNGNQRYFCKNPKCKSHYTTDNYFLSSKYGRRGKAYPIDTRIKICDEYRRLNMEGISQREVARRFGISPTTLKNWEEDYSELICVSGMLDDEHRKIIYSEKKQSTPKFEDILEAFLREQKS